MSGHRIRKWLGAGILAASVPIVGSAALAETKPPAAPAPKATKWELSEFDAVKNRPPAKGGSWYSLPEVGDEVLVRSRRKGAK